MDLKNSLVAIAGSSGFIGRHLVRTLKEKNIKVRYLAGDLLTGEGLERFISGADVVVNLVGEFYPPFKKQVETNVICIENLCKVAANKEVKKIIHFSGAAAYGSATKGAFKEGDLLLPDTLYGVTKKMSEEVCDYYHRVFGLPFTIFRPTNVYGPGSDHGVIYNFISSIKKEGAVTVFGDGEQERDLLYVEDLVDAIIKGIEYSGNYDVFNLGLGKTYSLNEVLNYLSELYGKYITLRRQKDTGTSIRVLAADNKKAREILKWQPRVTLKEGLKLTWESIR
ncbi:NAD(P)-dependent oxidoreductase [Candidatus Woesebacteria bacterium]|nr:NAD(P)-dependent oxidoreductase [Candidatus Woesebacteria bacterium]